MKSPVPKPGAPRCRQAGAVNLLAVLFLIAVIMTVLGITMTMNASSILDSNQQGNSVQALLLAESGVENAIQRFLTTACGSLAQTVTQGNGTITIGAGAGTDFDGVTALAANRCRVAVGAQITGTSVVRNIEAIIEKSDGAAFNFPDAPSMDDWASYGPSATTIPTTYDTTTCPASGSVVTGTNLGNFIQADQAARVLWDGTQPAGNLGSFNVNTTGVNNFRVAGYRENDLASTISAGTTISTALWYRKDRAGGVPPSFFMALDLVATDNTVYRLWCDAGTGDVVWTQVPAFNFTVPAGKTIDRARLVFDLTNRSTGAGILNIWWDQIQLSGGGGTSGIVAWKESIQ